MSDLQHYGPVRPYYNPRNAAIWASDRLKSTQAYFSSILFREIQDVLSELPALDKEATAELSGAPLGPRREVRGIDHRVWRLVSFREVHEYHSDSHSSWTTP